MRISNTYRTSPHSLMPVAHHHTSGHSTTSGGQVVQLTLVLEGEDDQNRKIRMDMTPEEAIIMADQLTAFARAVKTVVTTGPG